MSCNYSPKKCILAIDDEVGFLSLLTDALDWLDFRVLTASSPQEARFFAIKAGCLLFWSCVGNALCLLLGSSFNRFLRR